MTREELLKLSTLNAVAEAEKMVRAPLPNRARLVREVYARGWRDAAAIVEPPELASFFRAFADAIVEEKEDWSEPAPKRRRKPEIDHFIAVLKKTVEK